MRIYKRIDFTFQMIVLIIGLYCSVIYSDAFPFYFIVGAAQFTSAMIRVFSDRDRSIARRTYEKALFWLVIISLVLIVFSFVAPAIFFVVAFGWLFITPIYAICYLVVCAKETL